MCTVHFVTGQCTRSTSQIFDICKDLKFVLSVRWLHLSSVVLYLVVHCLYECNSNRVIVFCILLFWLMYSLLVVSFVCQYCSQEIGWEDYYSHDIFHVEGFLL